jgi:hypothetical protein
VITYSALGWTVAKYFNLQFKEDFTIGQATSYILGKKQSSSSLSET